jgi:OOP family OmpA-OmpF porin
MVLWALVCSLTVISALAATLDQLEAQRARVEAEQGALLAPTGYLRGVRALARAREATSDAARQKALAAAAAEFEAALQNIAIANEALDSVIESRDAANDAEAYRLAGSEWTKAEDWFGDAARKLEGGNLNAARERGARAEEAYRAAELTAIKVRCLSAARSAVSEAERARADRLAPRSLVAAQQALAAAEAALDTDRYATETPAADAARAEYLARLAIYISAQTQRVRDREATVEDLLLEAQSVMAELAEIAGTTPDFSNGYGNVAAELRAALKRIPVLEAELDQRRRQVVGLE